jgi:hypothetical protein
MFLEGFDRVTNARMVRLNRNVRVVSIFADTAEKIGEVAHVQVTKQSHAALVVCCRMDALDI